jgi:hypothetical protein
MIVAIKIESMKWSFHEGRGGAMAHLGHKVAPPVAFTTIPVQRDVSSNKRIET